MKNIETIILGVISKNLKISKKKIDKREKLDSLKNFDSLNFVKIILNITKKTKLKASTEKLSKVRTIEQLISVFNKK